MITEKTRPFAAVPIRLLLIAALTFITGRTLHDGGLDLRSLNCDMNGAEDLSAFFAP